MSKQIDVNRVASLLRKFFCTQKSRISLSLFQKEMKLVLNAKEAERLFDYLIDEEHYLTPISKRYFQWTLLPKEDSFCEDKVRDMFLTYPIQTVRSGNKTSHSKKSEIVCVCQLDPNDFTGRSDEQLKEIIEKAQNELKEREIRQAREAQLDFYAQALKCTREELPKVIEGILNLL